MKRRDFTINAMAYNEEEGIIDLYGGQNDIKNKIIEWYIYHYFIINPKKMCYCVTQIK